jgi:hypothetical protein
LIGDDDPPLVVIIDVDGRNLSLSTPSAEIGTWLVEEIHVRPTDPGFVLEVEGEELIITTSDDVAFATGVHLRWAPPRLRRMMAASLDHAYRDAERPNP